MILRKALLISAPGDGAAYSSGLNPELEATRNFLLSPRGGAWAQYEITTLNNPCQQEIEAAVKEMRADYTITFFSGKSFSDNQGNSFLVLNDVDFICDTELLNTSAKQLVLVDTCPEAFSEEVIHFTGKPDEFSLARRMYDKWIERCEPGQMIMHASDNRNAPLANGGLFTKKLLQVASCVPAVDDRFNLKSILATGHELPELMQQAGTSYVPEITYTNGNIKLPFAMALPATGRRGSGNENQSSTGIALGLFLLGLFLSLE